jgi:hypothetical protein
MRNITRFVSTIVAAAVAALVILPASARSDVLARYEMGENQGPFSFDPTTVAAGISASAISAGGGASLSFDAEFSNPYLILDSDGSGYFQITIDPALLMELEQPITLSIDARHPSGTMNDYTEVQYSYDGSTFFTADVFDSLGGSFDTFTASIPDELPGGTDDLTIRILAYRIPVGGTEHNPVDAYYDNLTINGTAVPEPASAGAIVTIVGGLACFGRRASGCR